jgi:hypothetical protein
VSLLVPIVLALAVIWASSVVVLVATRPAGASLREAMRLLPDTLGLLRRLATDPSVDCGARLRLWLLFAYLAMPFDL